MGFFDHLPTAPPSEPEPEPPRLPWVKPEDALAAVVAEQRLLAHTDDAVIAIIGLLVYPNGFEFTVSAVLRRDDRRGRMFDPGVHHWHGGHDEELPPAEFLRVGVQFADGRVASNLNRPPFRPDAQPAGPLLMQDGGGGGGRRYDMTYWVWPLPPPGPVAFICQWPLHGIPESRVEIDAQRILDAAARAIDLWPDDRQPSD